MEELPLHINNKIEQISLIIHPNHYSFSRDFQSNNKKFYNLNIHTLNHLKLKGKNDTSQIFKIKKPILFYKKGIRNIRCINQKFIKKIILRVRHERDSFILSSIKNFNGLIFHELRKIYGIQDELIIPLITENFLLFMENCDYEIELFYDKDIDMETINFLLDFEIIEINEDVLPTIQYDIDLTKMIEFNRGYREIHNIINEIEYVAPRLVRLCKVTIGNYKQFHTTVDHVGILQTIIIHHPNNKLVLCDVNLHIDNCDEFNVPTCIKTGKNVTILEFLPIHQIDVANNPAQFNRTYIHDIINNSDIISRCGLNLAMDFLKITINFVFEKNLSNKVQVYGTALSGVKIKQSKISLF